MLGLHGSSSGWARPPWRSCWLVAPCPYQGVLPGGRLLRAKRLLRQPRRRQRVGREHLGRDASPVQWTCARSRKWAFPASLVASFNHQSHVN